MRGKKNRGLAHLSPRTCELDDLPLLVRIKRIVARELGQHPLPKLFARRAVEHCFPPDVNFLEHFWGGAKKKKKKKKKKKAGIFWVFTVVVLSGPAWSRRGGLSASSWSRAVARGVCPSLRPCRACCLGSACRQAQRTSASSCDPSGGRVGHREAACSRYRHRDPTARVQRHQSRPRQSRRDRLAYPRAPTRTRRGRAPGARDPQSRQRSSRQAPCPAPCGPL
jgi:hypothetical protein